ncbi:hypothetical protein Lalb_Chr05g0224911 [Lupinus albus]|uniref:Uncharacterized protein n=1 Tax=Lupinus albus TaxID=3870 RepID=A0A6A4QKW1_LUPAL|nr:hypothetical protein Lalb_Chr05g0224911 [Lupinus albus]
MGPKPIVSLVSTIINHFVATSLSFTSTIIFWLPKLAFSFQFQLHFSLNFRPFSFNLFSPVCYIYKHIYIMDIFIPEEYVTKRRLEKKVAATSYGKGSKSHSHRNSNKIEVMDNKASSSTKGFGLIGDNVVFTCLSA